MSIDSEVWRLLALGAVLIVVGWVIVRDILVVVWRWTERGRRGRD